ncbi:MAG: branched-chain amino acid aminotransferase [Eubacteriales bacterium]|nr:branched-chain amino acid aminotransferase [Eubacteriales bacterium]
MAEIRVVKAETLKQKPTDESKLGFGQIFTDHMFEWDYDEGQGWHDPRVVPFHNFELSPASLVLHYGQSIFEGAKCYRREDGGLQLFRPQANFARFNKSADRLCIPQFDEETALAGLMKLLEIDGEWTPHTEGASLYIRPTIIATDPFVGVRAGKHYTFFIILSPSGPYYSTGLAPVGIYVEDEYVRAVRGGMGFAKTAGNYAASIKAGEVAKKKGYQQVLWLDGVERKYVDEVGAMNMMFVLDGKIVTPMLNGTILAGITRDSILTLARDMGYEVEERLVSIDEIFEGAKDGKLQEAFGTGTAAVISPVGELCRGEEKIVINGGKIGPVAQKMYDTLTGIQFGRVADPHEWILKVN